MPAVCSSLPPGLRLSGDTLLRCVLGDCRKENNPSKPKSQREVGDHQYHALSFMEES